MNNSETLTDIPPDHPDVYKAYENRGGMRPTTAR